MQHGKMVARIASSPIATSVAIGDANTRARDPRVPAMRVVHHEIELAEPEVVRSPPQLPPPLLSEGFAAAVVAARLPARPAPSAAMRSRLVDAWAPPPSDLRLTDRQV